jgi:hypothetical protein
VNPVNCWIMRRLKENRRECANFRRKSGAALGVVQGRRRK